MYEISDADARIQGERLLGIVQHLAPNGGEQEVAAEIYRRAVKREGHIGGMRVMAGVLSDGLDYGNWYWIKPGTRDVRDVIPTTWDDDE